MRVVFRLMVVSVLVAVLAGVAAGVLGCLWGGARARARGEAALRVAEGDARAARASIEELRRQMQALDDRAATLDGTLAEERRARAVAETQAAELGARLEEQRTALTTAEDRLGDTFKALAAEALARNNEGFLSLAAEKLKSARSDADSTLEARQKAIEGLLAPVRESLARVDGKIHELEKDRAEAYGRLTELVGGMAVTQARLETETGNLARALRAPAVRGRWGEIQLKRVVEVAGMVEHCDFVEQETLDCDDGRLRPDLIVRLPGGREVAVDAKVPLEAYLLAIEATDEAVRRERMTAHAAQVRAHVLKLSAKSYWAGLPSTPEFVVMFLPNEAMYGAALEELPALIEESVARRVLIATPTTLIALLQTVHHGWRQEKLAESAQRISEQGRLLHERFATLIEHWTKLGGALSKANDHFNAAVASFEGRVLPAARRLEELGAGSKKQVGELARIDTRPRILSAVADSDEPDVQLPLAAG